MWDRCISAAWEAWGCRSVTCERAPVLQSDLSDERWALIGPVITSWKARHPSASGHQGNHDMREIVHALLCQSRTGCQWDCLPYDLPPVGAVKYYFHKKSSHLAR
ncbi:transposase [Streptomyces sp. NPDC050743]|uniref:transposase n=1 Tax=Streptomyces sp. NPDC050743 TaxID=3365634 RepID=UPI00379E7AB3